MGVGVRKLGRTKSLAREKKRLYCGLMGVVVVQLLIRKICITFYTSLRIGKKRVEVTVNIIQEGQRNEAKVSGELSKEGGESKSLELMEPQFCYFLHIHVFKY